jgi:cystathionine beta-lyase
LTRLEASTLEVARWLDEQTPIEAVLHPALPSCKGHEFWKRDFTGSTSVFSIVFKEDIEQQKVQTFADALDLFKAGYSWGGTTALVVVYPKLERPGKDYSGRIVRLNIGLEEPADLIADLAQAFKAI